MAETDAADPQPQRWDANLQRVGTCPHCGSPVFVEPGGETNVYGLPKPIYLCNCRDLSVAAGGPRPADWTNTPPFVPPPNPPYPWWQPLTVPLSPALPATPLSPALPAMPPQPWSPNPLQPYVPDMPYGTPPYKLPEVTCVAQQPGGDF